MEGGSPQTRQLSGNSRSSRPHTTFRAATRALLGVASKASGNGKQGYSRRPTSAYTLSLPS